MSDEKKKKSWKTTAAGITAAIGMICTLIAVPLLDDDPSTVVEWASVIPAIIAAIATAFGFAVARDNNVSSEDSGAK